MNIEIFLRSISTKVGRCDGINLMTTGLAIGLTTDCVIGPGSNDMAHIKT